jgi:DNA ligase-1
MNEKNMMLGKDWDGEQDLTGWCLSEKLNGCRAYWDGEQFWTRGGHVIPNVPRRILATMPRGAHLDGEMFAGYGQLEAARLAVQFGKFTAAVRFIAFDAPQIPGLWPRRLAAAKALFPHWVPHITVARDNAHLVSLMARVVAQGGEGLVARAPGLGYIEGPTTAMLKIKPEFVRQ